MTEIISLRKLDPNDPTYNLKKSKLKSRLQCYTPSALLQTRKKGNVVVTERTGILQIDFDRSGIKDFDVEELKQAVFSLPFVGFCGLSCSGYGFYALILIEEPEKQNEYAEHCFEIFKIKYDIEVDTSKGRHPQDLRYISYDANMLFRENVEPLRINKIRGKTRPEINLEYKCPMTQFKGRDKLIRSLICEILNVQKGHRFEIVRKAAFTLGGMGKIEILQEIKAAIGSNNSFVGQENEFLKLAENCFREGWRKPLIGL